MTVVETAKRPRIVFCGCAHYEIIPRASKEQILAALQQNGAALEVVSDLCGLAANHDPRLKIWAEEAPLTIVACFPRAIRWLFHAAGVPLNGQARLFNMRTQAPEEIIAQIAGYGMRSAECSVNPRSEMPVPEPGWTPWFPVIDYDRCQNCKQCLNFCLFGVYALSDEGRVEVRKPAGCKTNCPACARVCPHQAIIFPKYADSHINGDEVPDQTRVGQPPSGDILETIRRRGAGHRRFASQTDGQSHARSCPTIEGLRRELGIPEDVLTSLSPAEIQRITTQSQGNSKQSSGQPANSDRKDRDHDG